MSRPLSPINFASPSWERPEARTAPAEKAGSSRQARPFLAALLLTASVALLVGGCVVAGWLGEVWGAAAALLGFAGYLILFARGLDQLPVDWSCWRERQRTERREETEKRDDRTEENNGGKT